MNKRIWARPSLGVAIVFFWRDYLYSWLYKVFLATEADYYLYEFEEIEERADLIVKGTKSETERQFIEYDHGGGPLSWYTVSKMDLVDVYKGDTEETFTIIEPFATDTNLDGRTIYSLGDYLPIEEDDQYILFLRLITDEETAEAFSIDLTSEKLYEIVGHYQGQHPLAENINASSVQHVQGYFPYEEDHYVQLHEKVIEKYR